MAEIAFENGRISNFQGLVTLTLDRVTLHTIVHHSSTSTYVPNFIEIEESFCGRTDIWDALYYIMGSKGANPAHAPLFSEWKRFFTARCYASAVYIYAIVECLSVCLSVTSRHCTQTAKHRITQRTLHDSRGTIVFWCQKSRRNSNGVTPYGCAKAQMEVR